MALYWDEESSSLMGKHYFLGIGIDNYHHIQGPHNCKTDIRRLKDYLLSRYQFERAHCTVLLDEDATKDHILAELQRMGQLLNEEDSLFLFFAGHGSMMDGDTEGYILPYDGVFEQRPTREEWILSTPALVVPILNIKARHILIIIDSGIRPYHFSLAAKGLQPEIEIDSRGFEGNLEHTISRWTVDATGIENEDGGVFLNNFLHVLEQDPHPRIGIGTIMAQIRRREDAQKSRLSLYGPIPELGDEGGEYHFYLKEELIQQNEALTLAWGKVKEKNSQSAYEQFIRQHPQTHFAQQAREKLRELEFMAWGETIESDQPEAYDTYLATYPNGIFTER